MAQYNIEEQLQQKLKDREIGPSANAWERVAYNRQAKKKQRKLPIWYWTAAAVIITGSLTFMFTDNTQPAIQVVVKENVPAPSPAVTPHIDTVTPQAVAVTSAKAVQKPAPEKVVTAQVIVNENTAVANVADPETKKAEEVANTIVQIAQTGTPVTDMTVDSLLAKAQREVAIEKQAGTLNGQKSSHIALLNEAEKEADKSFKDKVIKSVKQKFRTIKIALHD